MLQVAGPGNRSGVACSSARKERRTSFRGGRSGALGGSGWRLLGRNAEELPQAGTVSRESAANYRPRKSLRVVIHCSSLIFRRWTLCRAFLDALLMQGACQTRPDANSVFSLSYNFTRRVQVDQCGTMCLGGTARPEPGGNRRLSRMTCLFSGRRVSSCPPPLQRSFSSPSQPDASTAYRRFAANRHSTAPRPGIARQEAIRGFCISMRIWGLHQPKREGTAR
jgi:hypothetical protein